MPIIVVGRFLSFISTEELTVLECRDMLSISLDFLRSLITHSVL